MLEERGAQSDAEPVLRRTKAVTAVPDTTVPETAVPKTATRERAPAASPGKPLPAPRSERAITGVYRDPVTRAIVFAVFGVYAALGWPPIVATSLPGNCCSSSFSCQGIDGLVVIENVELVVQRVHEPLAYVQCSSRSWGAASRIGEHPDISVREWRPAQLRLASPHLDRNKAFRQAVVALGHSMS